MSPGPGAYRELMNRADTAFSEGIEADEFDQSFIHSPRVYPGKDTFRPQNYAEKAANRYATNFNLTLLFEGHACEERKNFNALRTAF